MPQLDREISMDELNTAIKNIGTGTSLDGLAPDISKILPLSMRRVILQLFQQIFITEYPKQWQEQLLFPHPKSGHTTSDPKLRGIAIGPLLSRMYDSIIPDR